MARRRTGDKLLPEPMITQFTDTSDGEWIKDCYSW